MTLAAPLYTVILEYRGGTYISQLYCTDLSMVLGRWAKRIPENDLAEWGLSRQALLTAIRDNSLVALANCVNAWCTTGLDDRDKQFLVNVVLTVEYARTKYS